MLFVVIWLAVFLQCVFVFSVFTFVFVVCLLCFVGSFVVTCFVPTGVFVRLLLLSIGGSLFVMWCSTFCFVVVVLYVLLCVPFFV